MGLDLFVKAVEKDKVTDITGELHLNYNDGKETLVKYITKNILDDDGSRVLFYSRKNEFLKKELQNAVQGTVTGGFDYLGMLQAVIVDDEAFERLQARISEFEKDIPISIKQIMEEHEYSSFHAAVVCIL